MRTSTQKFLKLRRYTVNCSNMQVLTVIIPKGAISCLTKVHRSFQHRLEYRGEVTGRRIDNLQYLGSCGLLLQGLTRLGDQPRILHRDDRLRREILDQRDLPVGK